MCTVTWWSAAEGYELYFSRDELKTRLPALPPEECRLDGVRYLSPRDGDAGGTWLTVNAFGLSVGLINQYPADAPAPPEPRVSRGILVREMASCRSVAELSDRLWRCDLKHYEPFQILGVEPDSTGSVHTWNGRFLAVTQDAHCHLPYTSSSYLSEEVAKHRRDKFARIIAEKGDMNPDDLLEFHRDHDAGAAAHSVFMQRDDAETVSFTQVVVSPEQITMAYAEKIPDEAAFATPHMVTLKPNSCVA